jgi:hypothetical protein
MKLVVFLAKGVFVDKGAEEKRYNERVLRMVLKAGY